MKKKIIRIMDFITYRLHNHTKICAMNILVLAVLAIFVGIPYPILHVSAFSLNVVVGLFVQWYQVERYRR